MNSSRGTDRLPQGAGELGRAGAAVSVAGVLANLLSYLVPLIGARTLDPDNLGAIAACMAILAITSVPGMGLQLAVAISRAKHGSTPGLVRLVAISLAAAVVPLLALTPVIASGLRLPWQAVPLVAIISGSVVIASGWLGVLQGSGRFSRLAAGLVLLGLTRCGGIIIGLLLGSGLLNSLTLGASGALLCCAAIGVLARFERGSGFTPARALWAASSATLVFFVLSYADLIAARNLLSPTASANYAVLNVLTKGAIWAPQSIGILAVPYFARAASRARWVATLAVGAVGLILVLATVLFGQFALRLAGGPPYEHLAGLGPYFALLGALYAIVFVLLNAQVASGAKAPALPLWLAAAGFVGVVFLLPAPSITGIVACAIVTAVVSTIALGIGVWINMRSTRATEPVYEDRF